MTESVPVETIDNLFVLSKETVCCVSEFSGTSQVSIGESALLEWPEILSLCDSSLDQAHIETS